MVKAKSKKVTGQTDKYFKRSMYLKKLDKLLASIVNSTDQSINYFVLF